MKAPFYKKEIFYILTILIVGLSAYSFILNSDFKTLDDQFSIVENQEIKSFANFKEIFQGGFFKDRSYYRPLVSLSYMIEFHFFDLNPFFYNLDNVLVHLGCTVLVFLIIQLIFESSFAGFCIALLFAIHPVQIEAVSNIAGRSIVLCGFFFALAFWFFLQREKTDKGFYLWLSTLAFTLSILSKEQGIVFPAVVGSYLFLFRKEKRMAYIFNQLTPFVVIAFLYLLLRKYLHISHVFYWNSPKELTLGILTFLRGLLTYFRLFLFPCDIHFDRARIYFVDFNTEVITTFVIFLSLLVFLFQWRKKISKEYLFFLLETADIV